MMMMMTTRPTATFYRSVSQPFFWPVTQNRTPTLVVIPPL